jgi:hypothetical protein
LTEHLNQDESFCLILVGTVAPALIFSGLTAVAVGVYQGVTTGSWFLSTIVPGGGALGGGCGMLASLIFYYLHRNAINRESAIGKTAVYDIDD